MQYHRLGNILLPEQKILSSPFRPALPSSTSEKKSSCALRTTLPSRYTPCTPLHATSFLMSCDLNLLLPNKPYNPPPTGSSAMILCSSGFRPEVPSLSLLRPTPPQIRSFSLYTSQSHRVSSRIQLACSSP